MKWSAKLGEFTSISVRVHATFLILIAWVGFAHWQAERSVGAILAGIPLILALFACVLLHEFGHALTAKRFGIKTPITVSGDRVALTAGMGRQRPSAR